MLLLVALSLTVGTQIQGMTSLSSYDPYPLYSSIYPYALLATHYKEALQHHKTKYLNDRVRVSISPFSQSADRGRNSYRNRVPLGDIHGRTNMIALFYDSYLKTQLEELLAFEITEGCAEPITNPIESDPNKEFGFFSIPLQYKKRGARFEAEMLLFKGCGDAIGFTIKAGVAEVKQSDIQFNDLTPQALGIACPVATKGCADPGTNTCAVPNPQDPTGVSPVYMTADAIAAPSLNCPYPPENTIYPPQRFKPCCDSTLCLTYDCTCKQEVIEHIMRKHDTIAQFLGLDYNDYQKLSAEDLRLGLYWRHVYNVVNEENTYARLLVTPFVEAEVAIPFANQINTHHMFAAPLGNNHHASFGAMGGFTFDFLDSIDLTISGAYTTFLKQQYSHYHLPTNTLEGGIYPYDANVTIKPAGTWNVGVGIHAEHFLANLSMWAEYMFISHGTDDITICQPFIPEGSDYYTQGFLIKLAESRTQWEAQLFNIGLNYDISDHIVLGFLWQAPVWQRNGYQSGTVLGTITVCY